MVVEAVPVREPFVTTNVKMNSPKDVYIMRRRLHLGHGWRGMPRRHNPLPLPGVSISLPIRSPHRSPDHQKQTSVPELWNVAVGVAEEAMVTLQALPCSPPPRMHVQA